MSTIEGETYWNIQLSHSWMWQFNCLLSYYWHWITLCPCLFKIFLNLILVAFPFLTHFSFIIWMSDFLITLYFCFPGLLFVELYYSPLKANLYGFLFWWYDYFILYGFSANLSWKFFMLKELRVVIWSFLHTTCFVLFCTQIITEISYHQCQGQLWLEKDCFYLCYIQLAG